MTLLETFFSRTASDTREWPENIGRLTLASAFLLTLTPPPVSVYDFFPVVPWVGSSFGFFFFFQHPPSTSETQLPLILHEQASWFFSGTPVSKRPPFFRWNPQSLLIFPNRVGVFPVSSRQVVFSLARVSWVFVGLVADTRPLFSGLVVTEQQC